MPAKVAGFCFWLKVIAAVYTGFYFPTKSKRKQKENRTMVSLDLLFSRMQLAGARRKAL